MHPGAHRRVRGRLAGVVIAVATVAAVWLVMPAADASRTNPSPDLATPGFLLDKGRYTTIRVPDSLLAGGLIEVAPLGINERGQMVGGLEYGDATNAVNSGFRRDPNGRYVRVDVPGARGTAAQDINDRGQIVGVYSEISTDVQAPDGRLRGFLLDEGRFTRIDFPGARQTQAFGINNRRQVVGEYVDGDGVAHGFRWERGRFTTLDVPGSDGTSATDINDRGRIVGAHGDLATQTLRGFVWDGRRYNNFQAPGAGITLPFGINDRGQIVGTSISDVATGAAGGFLTNGVNSPFVAVAVPGSPDTVPFAINDRGQIVGTFQNPAAATSVYPMPLSG